MIRDDILLYGKEASVFNRFMKSPLPGLDYPVIKHPPKESQGGFSLSLYFLGSVFGYGRR